MEYGLMFYNLSMTGDMQGAKLYNLTDSISCFPLFLSLFLHNKRAIHHLSQYSKGRIRGNNTVEVL